MSVQGAGNGNGHRAPVPHRINLNPSRSQLEVVWNGGSVSRIDGQVLRSFCPCARCRARQTLGMQLITDDSRISSVSLAGGSGLQVIFGDGHDRGIYPWAYLHAIAQGNVGDMPG